MLDPPAPRKTAAAALPPTAREELHVVQLVAARHRIIKAGELYAAGVSRSAVARWVARGRIRREHRGVYVYGNGPLDQDGQHLAAVSAIGEDAALGFISVAVHAGFWPFAVPETVDVVVPRQVRSRRRIRVHSVAELPPSAVTELRGVPMTTPARAIRDLAGELRSDRAFRRIVHEAQVQGKVTFAALADEFDRAPSNVPGRQRLIKELEAGPTPTRSGFEDWGADLLRRHGFPRLVTNAHPPGTPAWVEVDILLPDSGLIIELDGDRYHNTPWRREQDAYKRALLKEHGYPVLVLTEEQASNEEEGETVERIWTTLLELG
jgi:hypothetical protein